LFPVAEGLESSANLRTLKVHLTKSDLVWFNILILPRSRLGQISLGIYVALGLAGGIATGGVPPTLDEVVYVFLYVVVVVMICLVCFLFFLVPFILLSFRSPGLLGEHVFTLDQDGLRERTTVNDTLIRWGGVHDLHRTGSFILIGVSPMVFHVLPRRFFASQTDFDAFWAAIQPLKRRASRV
jgi:hypothetical protein